MIFFERAFSSERSRSLVLIFLKLERLSRDLELISRDVTGYFFERSMIVSLNSFSTC